MGVGVRSGIKNTPQIQNKHAASVRSEIWLCCQRSRLLDVHKICPGIVSTPDCCSLFRRLSGRTDPTASNPSPAPNASLLLSLSCAGRWKGGWEGGGVQSWLVSTLHFGSYEKAVMSGWRRGHTLGGKWVASCFSLRSLKQQWTILFFLNCYCKFCFCPCFWRLLHQTGTGIQISMTRKAILLHNSRRFCCKTEI